jgi:hypothetical protein
VVNGPGNRAAFEAAVDALKLRLHEDDLLFIHTNNHGDNDGTQSFLSAYPAWGEYFANDFAAKLGELPRYQSLIVMMEQCNSGGFNERGGARIQPGHQLRRQDRGHRGVRLRQRGPQPAGLTAVRRELGGGRPHLAGPPVRDLVVVLGAA